MRGPRFSAIAFGVLALLCAVALAQDSEDATAEDAAEQGDAMPSSFYHGFVASFAVIVVSELGDKTFFIAAVMAMRHPRSTIFLGGVGALGLMTVLSAYLGHAVTVVPRVYTQWISTLLFVFFGLKMLKEGFDMAPDEGAEELEEVTLELKKKEEEMESQERTDVEGGVIKKRHWVSPILVQAFTLTFLAEWGDRSQIATIILGAREDPIAVSLGAVIGHALCTWIAVMGGRMIAQSISVRTVTITGGVVFLIFAVSGFLLEEWSKAGEDGVAADVLD
eukprot:m.180747 g.180747  ORF g.180747 m.180747 type:complete len:278 (-) comp18018_c0_seq3:65-898(-)